MHITDKTARNITWLLAAGIALLAVLYLCSSSRWFDLDKEWNIPTTYNAFLFLLAGLTALWNIHGRQKWAQRLPWAMVGTAMIFASVDEMVGIHERITKYARDIAGGLEFHNVWMLIYIPILVVGGKIYTSWWRELYRDNRQSALYFLGGLGVWFLAFSTELPVQWKLLPTIATTPAILIEETLEMTGALLWFRACTLEILRQKSLV